jgi:pilus assembly protein FimV
LLDPSELAYARRGSETAVADASSAAPALAQPLPLAAPESAAAPVALAATAAAPSAVATTAVATTASVTQRIEPRTPPAVRTDGTLAPHRIAAKDTLRAIVRRAGARSESSAQRMMIAIFHSNPNAFDGNINRLHKGAMLNMPGAAALAAINTVDARREVENQMAAWRGGAKVAGRSHPFKAESMASAQLTPELPQKAPMNEPDREPNVLLDQRVQTLEQSLGDLKGLLAVEHAKLLSIQQQTSIAPTASPQLAAATPAPAPPAANSRLVPIAAGLGILMAGFAVGRLRRTGPVAQSKNSRPADDNIKSAAKAESSAIAPVDSVAQQPADSVSQAPAETATLVRAVSDTQEHVLSVAHAQAISDAHAQAIRDAETQAISDAHAQTITEAHAQAISDAYALADSDATQLAPAAAEVPTVAIDTRRIAQAAELPPTSRLPRPPHGETTVNLALDTVVLGTNLVEPETTAQHVQMPSVMHEHVVIAERRTNIVQVLKMAIERDPHRRDLRMKLLEVYYHAAATNRLAFLEIARKLARERDQLAAGEWDRIVAMGREIAADDPLFGEQQASAKPLADCA